MNILDRLKGIDRVIDIPIVDVSAMRVIRLLDDPESNFDQICTQLSPGIMAKFLEMANNAYYGRKVNNIEYAVRVLGYDRMKQILVVSLLMEHFSKSDMPHDFNYQRFQGHANLCACISRVFAEIFEMDGKEDLITISMIHDIGKLIIAVYCKDEFSLIEDLKKRGIPEIKAEKDVLGMDHAEVGALLLKKFGISDEITEPIRVHHSYDSNNTEDKDYFLKMVLKQSVVISDMFYKEWALYCEEIKEVFDEITIKGKEIRDEMVRDHMRDKGYREIFPGLLRNITVYIVERLSKYLRKSFELT